MSLSKPDTGEGTLSMSSIHGALSSGATLSWIWSSSGPRPAPTPYPRLPGSPSKRDVRRLRK